MKQYIKQSNIKTNVVQELVQMRVKVHKKAVEKQSSFICLQFMCLLPLSSYQTT